MNTEQLAQELAEAKVSNEVGDWTETQALNYLNAKHPEVTEEEVSEAFEQWRAQANQASADKLEQLTSGERRSPDEPYPYEIVAEELEEYGTSRADFRELSQAQREEIAKPLARARRMASKRDDTEPDEWKRTGVWRSHLEKEKNTYNYVCGEYGIDKKEVRVMWWNYVYEHAPPYMRNRLV